MDPILFLLLLVSLSTSPVSTTAQVQPTTSHIIVTGSVFCDVCYNNKFTQYSYFLPGADVHVECKFQGNAPRTKEKITFSVNRTTNRYGVYKLDIPSVEGVDCVEGPAIQSLCEASLIKSSVPGCNITGVSITTKEITAKSKSTNLCVYSISALSYRPFEKNSTLCGNYDENLLSDSFNSSKFFLPYFPWQFPPLPQLPPFPQLPPLPQLPPFPQLPPLPPLPQLPPFPSFPPFQFPGAPPFQFPPAPPFQFPSTPPSLPYPPPNFAPVSRPPVFNLGDPRTWTPNLPPPSTPTSPFNPTDPRTWTPRNPFAIPPPPPRGFDLRDTQTWIPTFAPSPNSPQNQQP